MEVNTSAASIDPSTMERYKKQFFKTTMCKYNLENSCKKGDQCSHAHSVKELQEKPILSKTRMCKMILRLGNCNDPDCSFAHDIEELVSANAFFRTKMCDFFMNGGCKLGDKCRYAHAEEELNQPVNDETIPSCGGSFKHVPRATSIKSIPPVDFNDSPDTGYPMRKRGSLSSRATMASSYASFSSFANFQDIHHQHQAVVPTPVMYVYHPMAVMYPAPVLYED